jgi:hypothetical protein
MRASLPEEPAPSVTTTTKQSTGYLTHSERGIGVKEVHGQRHPVPFPQYAPSSTAAGQLSQRTLYESQPQLLNYQSQSRPSNLPHRGSKEIAPTKVEMSPQCASHQLKGLQSRTKKQPSPAISDTSSRSEPKGNIQLGNSNELQRGLEADIHKDAAAVIGDVSGDRHRMKTDIQRPYDPNLLCPMCMKRFRIGEIQKFKRHVSTCDGTDADDDSDSDDDIIT